MMAPLAKFIDRSVLQIGYAMLPQSMWREDADERDLKLEEAVQFLNGPEFMPAESQPAQLDFIPGAEVGSRRQPRKTLKTRKRVSVQECHPRKKSARQLGFAFYPVLLRQFVSCRSYISWLKAPSHRKHDWGAGAWTGFFNHGFHGFHRWKKWLLKPSEMAWAPQTPGSPPRRNRNPAERGRRNCCRFCL